MRYPIRIVYSPEHGAEFGHPRDKGTTIQLGGDTPYGIAWSDGTLTACSDAHFEELWVDYATGGREFTELVRRVVGDELQTLLRAALS